MHSISLTALSAVLVSVTVSTIQYSNAYHSIYTMAYYYKNEIAHKCCYYAYDSNATSTFSFSTSMFRVHKCTCVINSMWLD